MGNVRREVRKFSQEGSDLNLTWEYKRGDFSEELGTKMMSVKMSLQTQEQALAEGMSC